MTHILDQGDTWVDKQGVAHTIAQMDGRHAFNVYTFLKRRHAMVAREYMKHLSSVPEPNGVMAIDTVEAAISEEMDRLAKSTFLWLLDKPLLKALASRVEADRRDRGWTSWRVEPYDFDRLGRCPEESQ